MAEFKADLVNIMKRYFVIDDNSVGIQYSQESGGSVLTINSAVLRRKPEHEAYWCY